MKALASLATIASLLASTVCPAERVAITFDDLPLNGTLQPGVDEAEIVRQVLPILAAHESPPVYGFINARKLEANSAGAQALQVWIAGGHRVGNHTYSHVDLTTNPVEAFELDIRRNEPALLLLSADDEWRWFRYPYLHEGDTLDKRRAVRKAIHDRGYAIAQTTIDYEDYLWNSAYARCVEKADERAIRWLRSSYLDITRAYIDLSRALAQQVYGREIDHVLLLHLGAFTPAILPPLLELLEEKGFTLATLETVQRDPAYRSDPDFASRRGGTLLEQHMDARKLPYPPFPAKPAKELNAICR